MSDFNKPYLRLLREQVEVEIKYLQSVGHDTKHPEKAFIWCNEYKNQNICNRLRELREFLSQIMVRLNQKPLQETPQCDFTRLALSHDESLPLLPESNPFPETV